MFQAAFLTVRRPGDSDVFEFRREHQKMTFGRDDQCDIVIPATGNDLSRLAGVIWRAEGELWIRNLSCSHELEVALPGEAQVEPMRTRREDGADPGYARAVGADMAYVSARGALLLIVHQGWPVDGAVESSLTSSATLRVSAVPDNLRAVAAALCEPLLDGGRLPAAYSAIVQRLHCPTLRQVRSQVEQLCKLYETEVPALAAKVAERRQRDEEELALTQPPILRNGVWVFPAVARPTDGPTVRVRPRALVLPDYYEVAHLLVRRHLITEADVRALAGRSDR
jgi:hypothetical protein